MRRHAGLRGGGLHVVVDEPRRVEERGTNPPLTWPENPAALPFLDAQGDLVIPLDCPVRFRWWQGGQSVERTLAELNGARRTEEAHAA